MIKRLISVCIAMLIASCTQFPSSTFDESLSNEENIRFFTDVQRFFPSSYGPIICRRPGCMQAQSRETIKENENKMAVIDLSSRRKADNCFTRSCIRYDIYIEEGPRLFLELKSYIDSEEKEAELLSSIPNKYFVPYDRVDDWYREGKTYTYDPKGAQEYVLINNDYLKLVTQPVLFKPISTYDAFSSWPGGPNVDLPYDEYSGMTMYFDDAPPVERGSGSSKTMYRSVILKNGESFYLRTTSNGSSISSKVVPLEKYEEVLDHPAYKLIGNKLHSDGEAIVQRIEISTSGNRYSADHLLITDKLPPITWRDYSAAIRDLDIIGKVNDYDRAIFDLTKVRISEQRAGTFRIEPARNNRLGSLNFSSLFPFVTIKDGEPRLGHFVIYIGERPINFHSVEISIDGQTYEVGARGKWFDSYIDHEVWPYFIEGFSFFGNLDHLNLANNVQSARVYFIGNGSVSGIGTNGVVLETSRNVTSLYKNIRGGSNRF